MNTASIAVGYGCAWVDGRHKLLHVQPVAMFTCASASVTPVCVCRSGRAHSTQRYVACSCLLTPPPPLRTPRAFWRSPVPPPPFPGSRWPAAIPWACGRAVPYMYHGLACAMTPQLLMQVGWLHGALCRAVLPTPAPQAFDFGQATRTLSAEPIPTSTALYVRMRTRHRHHPARRSMMARTRTINHTT